MSIEIKLYCEECGHEVDGDYIVCNKCYDELKEEIRELRKENKDLEADLNKAFEQLERNMK
jgi:predicted nuclease with TOPRIM domain